MVENSDGGYRSPTTSDYDFRVNVFNGNGDVVQRYEVEPRFGANGKREKASPFTIIIGKYLYGVHPEEPRYIYPYFLQPTLLYH